MQQYKTLIIEGGKKSIENFLLAIEQSLKNGWSRNKKDEQEFAKNIASPVEKYFFIDCPKMKNYHEATIKLSVAEGEVKLFNVLDKRRIGFSLEEHNGIIDEFYNKFVKSAASLTGVLVMLDKGEKSIEEIMGKRVAKKLKIFAHMANKSTVPINPIDQEGWFDFIILSHSNELPYDTEALANYLLQEGWKEKVVSDLICEYETLRALLKEYDKQKCK